MGRQPTITGHGAWGMTERVETVSRLKSIVFYHEKPETLELSVCTDISKCPRLKTIALCSGNTGNEQVMAAAGEEM